ncbi:MAG: GspH/FimT family pseudopilin [Aquincola sp.]|nr:GspH/FimT family pseudopilin [Aquincola sp.]MDH4288241.1 GspH/FimT family pseudopilin [Aquincola sp.]MDH5331978.1 GspH/FimT family pseudopilin [Aquincola sp.]
MKLQPASPDRRGFTLIELIVAMAVLAIIAVVAAPAFGEYFATQRVKSAAEELLTDFQYARMESVQRNAAVAVNMASNGYTITQGANTLKSVTLASGSSVSSGSTVVATFEPTRGTAALPNGGVVTLANSGTSRTLRVTISPIGRVNICSPSGALKGYDAC